MNEIKHHHIVIIGGGILGFSIAYLLSYNIKPSTSILLIEQEPTPAFHASSRNTGKVHAPFLYDPLKKKMFAKSASIGFEMLSEYCQSRNLPFVKDGILEVATDDNGLAHLQKYLEWGYSNGLSQEELQYLDKKGVAALEPNVVCTGAIHCTKDASVNYGDITRSLMVDAQNFGCKVMLGTKVVSVKSEGYSYFDQGLVRLKKSPQRQDPKFQLKLLQIRKIPKMTLSPSALSLPNISDEESSTVTNYFTEKHKLSLVEVSADYLINVAGGAALAIAQGMGLAKSFMALHFRGEYWVAPSFLRNLTKMSIYSVPRYPEYPFLDPHWVVRIDGRREVGPNAVMVSGPFAYNWNQNMRLIFPKFVQTIRDSGRVGLFSLFTDKKFVTLALHELKSSLSKRAMINRAKRFLPSLDPSQFTKRGTSGIRSSLIDADGKFVPDISIVESENSLHILNYNSPGATGALPVAALIVNRLIKQDKFRSSTRSSSGVLVDSASDLGPVSKWDVQHISDILT